MPHSSSDNTWLRRALWATALPALVTGAVAATPTATTAPSAAKGPPVLAVTLKPHASDGALDAIEATYVLQGVRVGRGEPLVHLPLVVASIPSVRYDGDALSARDAHGSLPLTQKDGEPKSFGTDREWLASRASSGAITVKFRALPRQVDANTRPGPLFDLRAEAGGLMGAGLTFLPAVSAPGDYRIRVHWDLTGLSSGARAVSCHGDGDFSLVAPADALTQCYYAVGPLHVYPAGEGKDRKFGIYWLSETPFDVPALAAQIEKLFAYMSVFFHDDGGSYRVFIRKNPYNSGGGTALSHSFMFGWTSERPPTLENLEGLLAHEMTHNWPMLEGEHGETSWYSEGNAEYYSILLSWRAGVIDADEFLKRINARSRNYYQNPLQNLTLQQAEERYWQEANASYVPYGRGWMYLAKTDAEIRAHSHGRRSLDDVVVALADRARRKESYTVADWIELVTQEIGPQAKSEYQDMVAGVRLVPPGDTFGPCFRPETFETRLNDLGFDENSLRGAHKVIHGLRTDSNAALAGLRDGDEVLSRSAADQDDPNHEITLTIRRDGVERKVRFVPEGKSVSAYRWVRVTTVPDGACRY